MVYCLKWGRSDHELGRGLVVYCLKCGISDHELGRGLVVYCLKCGRSGVRATFGGVLPQVW